MITRRSCFRTRPVTPHLDGRLVLALAKINHMAEQTVRRQFDIADRDDHFGLHPMDPAKHQRRPELAAPCGRNGQGHLVYRERV